MRGLIALIFALFFIFEEAQTQGHDKMLIGLSGIVHTELLEPMPFVHISISNRKKGTITDQNGLFSFVVIPKDTIIFSSVGFKSVRLIIPDTVKYTHYPVDVVMYQDTFMIKEVKIFPWKTYEEFKQAFIKLELPEDDMERARKNIAIIKTQIILANSAEPNLNYRYVMQQQYDRTMIQGQYPSISLLNPFAWAKFIEALKEGKFKSDNGKKKD